MLNKNLLLIVVFGFFGCSTMPSLYQASDCEPSPEKYGRCFADLGYTNQGYETLIKHCSKHGKKLNYDEFLEARHKRLAEKCSTPDGVFTLAFRSTIKVNGPETCPEVFLTKESLRKANADGRMAGAEYNQAFTYAEDSKKAEIEREKADEKGFWDGLWNRVTKTSPDTYTKKSNQSASDSKKLRELYPKVRRTALTERLKCNPEGAL